MEVLTGLFIVGLYKATEKIWEKGFDAAWEPVGEALKGRFTRWAGRDKETERQAAFARAAKVARANTLRYAADPPQAEKILDALNGERDKRGAEALAEEAAKLMLFSATPDVPRLTEICHRTLRFETLFKETPPPPEAVAAVLSDFLTNLREALLDQEPYHDLIQREMLRALRDIVAELRPVAYDDEATYRAQVAEMYRQLEFVGIPELKERRPITVEDIFIRLRAEREVEVEEPPHIVPGEPWPEAIEEAMRVARAKLPRFVKERAEVDEALRETNRLVVLGDPGAGKTTLLKYLAVICAEGRAQKELGLTVGRDGDSPLPIFVPLREFAAECAQREEDYNLLDHLYTCAREHLLLNLPPGFFEEALDDGRCLVCLDGLDEVWAVGRRKDVRDAVKALAVRFPRSRYLVTSRIVGYEEAPLNRRDFVHHTILPFENDDIRQFVRKWYEARERDPVQRQQKADDLIATIEREPRIRSLAQNPLLLTIIALVHRIEAELPHERVKLYDKCVTALVETWEEVKGLSLEEKQRPFYRYRRRLLERLAYELHAGAEEPGQLRTVKEGDLELLLSRFLMENRRLGFAEDFSGARDEAQAFIHLARGRTGLLVERGEGVFGFPHLTFQEYLAACDIENRCIHRGVEAIWEQIEPRLHDSHWREVILLLLGSLNKYDEPPTLLVERILEAGQDDKFEPVLHRHLYLAAHALADKVDVADELHRDVVDEILEIVHEELWWEDALTALSRLEGDRYAADRLLALARDSQVEAEVRGAAAEALGQLGLAKEAAEILVALGRNPQVEDQVRWAAANALEGLRRAEEAGDVRLALACDSQVEAEMRTEAVLALGRLVHIEKKVQDRLLAVARDSYVENCVRWLAALVLVVLNKGFAEEGEEILLALARDSQVEAEVRIEAAEALHRAGRAEEARVIVLALARDSQVEALVRLGAAEGLGRLGCAEEAEEILLALARDPEVEDWVHTAAAHALAQIGSAEVLLALARDPQMEAEVRSLAAWGLGCVEEARQVLLALARDPEVKDRVRNASAAALGQLGYVEEARDILLSLAHDPEVEDRVRAVAISCMMEVSRPAAGEAGNILLALARDPQMEVRHNAVWALGQLGRAEDQVLDTLLARALDPQEEDKVSTAAYESLKALVGMTMD